LEDIMTTTLSTKRDLAERLFAVIDGKRWHDYETVVHPDVTMISPFGVLHSAAEWAAFSAGFAEAIPDGTHAITDVLEDGDRAVVCGTWTGTHTGPLSTPQGSVPPTGRSIELPFCAVSTVRDGRIAWVQVYLDQLSMMIQLGLAPGA
jgi:predicted ester cyclase